MRRFVTVIFIMMLAVNLSGCDAIYRILQPEGAEEWELIGEINPYEPDEEVLMVQQRLKLFGYAVGTPDGKLGSQTRNAIKAFKKDNGLPESRFVTYVMWDKLMRFDDYGLIVDGEVNPYAIQVALNAAGFNVGKEDGKIGQRSMAQLKAFQEANGLKPDGRVGYRTLSVLVQYLAPLESNSQQ